MHSADQYWVVTTAKTLDISEEAAEDLLSQYKVFLSHHIDQIRHLIIRSPMTKTEQEIKINILTQENIQLRNQFDGLKKAILNQRWHEECKIIVDYMPPFPFENTKPIIAVAYTTEKSTRYLRYSKGPQQGFFWDMYPDNMLYVELAIIAISQAPYPL